MMLGAGFEQRKSDVEAHFRCLEFITGIESHKGIPIGNPTRDHHLLVDQQIQCCMKAQTLIILYNMVESTICDCLYYIYDSVADDELTYAELTDEMRNMWTVSCKRGSRIEAGFCETDKMPLKVVFTTLSINTSGNIDIRKIYDIFDKHGCVLSEENREECGNSFLTVKNKRNQLAHGNISFSQCGSNYLYSDLEKMKCDISCFLEMVIDSTNKFVEDKKYKRL